MKTIETVKQALAFDAQTDFLLSQVVNFSCKEKWNTFYTENKIAERSILSASFWDQNDYNAG